MLICLNNCIFLLIFILLSCLRSSLCSTYCRTHQVVWNHKRLDILQCFAIQLQVLLIFPPELICLLKQFICLQKKQINLCLWMWFRMLKLRHRYALESLGDFANSVSCNIQHPFVLVVCGMRLAACLYPVHYLLHKENLYH